MEEYNHKEAYCRMQYRCESCKNIEVLWNSRDGVTPFIIDCTCCGGKARHVNWAEDMRLVDYVPEMYERVFTNITLSKSIEYAKKRVEAMKMFDKGQFYFDYKKFENMERFIEIVCDIYKNAESPDIITGSKYNLGKVKDAVQTKVLTEWINNKEGIEPKIT